MFSVVTLSTGSYMSQVSKQRPVFGYFCYFHKMPNQIFMENVEMAGEKILDKKIFLIPWLRENCGGWGEEMKEVS